MPPLRHQRPTPSSPWPACATTNAAAPPVGTAPAATPTSSPVDAGATATLLDVKGPGVITHIWFTINSDDHMHLKNLVLRAWWDGESSPSIEAPIGDFYGLMLGDYFVYQSALLVVAPMKALNAYFQMPFDTAAKITITNEGKVRTNNLYYAIDYTTVPALPANPGRFHAQYRQAAPIKKSADTSGKNLNGTTTMSFSKPPAADTLSA